MCNAGMANVGVMSCMRNIYVCTRLSTRDAIELFLIIIRKAIIVPNITLLWCLSLIIMNSVFLSLKKTLNLDIMSLKGKLQYWHFWKYENDTRSDNNTCTVLLKTWSSLPEYTLAETTCTRLVVLKVPCGVVLISATRGHHKPKQSCACSRRIHHSGHA